MLRRFTLACLAASILLPAAVMADDNAECLGCHGTKDSGAPFVKESEFAASIHGKHLCTSCHTDASALPHPKPLAPISCKNCHRVESQIYLTSDHGRAVAKGMGEAAACKDCHGHTHTLLNSRNLRSPVNRVNIAKTCIRCHDDDKRMGKFKLTISHPFESYSHSVHGEAFKDGKTNAATCSDCHGTHDLHGAANSQGRIFWRNVPDTCGRCHSNVLSVYRVSIHGQTSKAGVKESPVCTSCHGEHTIRPVKDAGSSAYAGAVTKTCSACHASESLAAKFGLPLDRAKSYLDTYHGLAYQRGDLKVANCASCHGFHDVLPHTDPLSSIHQDNLARTCGRCHPGAGAQLTKGSVHGPSKGKHWSLHLVTVFYYFVIPLTIGGMLFHNGLDFLRKALRDGHGHAVGHGGDLRMNVNERVQHAVLTVTFILLAVTGFALKYPEAWWTMPFSLADEGLRRGLHRWAAVFFLVLSIYHLGYLLLTQRGRGILWGLLPRLRDAKDAVLLMLYNLGLRSERPELATPYNYIEKAEYWALVWGTFVMVVSGLLLAFSNLTLRYLPLWAPDLATLVHFYEAVLACLAIATWHSYWVVFDPDVYPMNWSWLTGYVRRKR
ncbi:MAG: cytochrome b/b6 domain-containing protein [Elusimicrobia bacterium]|nr:cytochrome b/b6 domain-containing protein [Elusimicrobiota bacterium]